MTRIIQPEGAKGSLKWIQRAVNVRPETLDAPLQARIGAGKINWRSPLIQDDFAEYRDAAFLTRIGLDDLREDLAAFWPRRGPQWDALATTDAGDVLLIEAKAHIAELFSSPTQANAASLELIERALRATSVQLRASPKAPWSQCFYQYANRLAHLAFLRRHGKPAWLVLVSFVGDGAVGGPHTAEAWDSAYAVIDHVLGLRADHGLARYIIHIHPDVRELQPR